MGVDLARIMGEGLDAPGYKETASVEFKLYYVYQQDHLSDKLTPPAYSCRD